MKQACACVCPCISISGMAVTVTVYIALYVKTLQLFFKFQALDVVFLTSNLCVNYH